MVSIMVTNGGPHPADKWADTTTEALLNLIQVPDDSVTAEAAQARQIKRDLRGQLFDVLMAHHDGVQKEHRKGLAKLKVCQKSKQLDVTAYMDTADEVLALFATTPFATHFAQEHVGDVVRQIVGQHTADVIHIERCFHSDGLARKEA